MTAHDADNPMPQLTDADRATYEWQMWTDGVGESGQRKLKGATVLVSRVGGVGSVVAYELAAAGVGRLVLAHAGQTKPSDLNRQLLMTHDNLGRSRVECAAARLRDLNPRLDIIAVSENVSPDNADELVAQADVVVDCAPLFTERFAMNDAAVRGGKPMVECAMYDTEAQCTTIVPGRSPCLRCLYPDEPAHWKRQFPVFGAVSGTIACIAAFEAIKLIVGLGDPLTARMLTIDFRSMIPRVMRIARDPRCPACAMIEEPNP